VKSRGGRYASSLGIDLTAADAGERFKWFLAAVLFGTRISAALAIRTWKAFAARGVITPELILQTGWEGLVAILDAGGYVRYDYKTATKLLDVCASLERDYSGSLDQLHDAAADASDLQQRIKALGKGIGDTTSEIYSARAARPLGQGRSALVAAGTFSGDRTWLFDARNEAPSRRWQACRKIWTEEAQPNNRLCRIRGRAGA
jgi:hypothetical protein